MAGDVPISGLPAATATSVNDLVPSTQADGVTRKITLGQITNLVTLSQSFLDLTDTPTSYSGQNDKLVSVNSVGNALEFTEGDVILNARNGLTEDAAHTVRMGGLLTENTEVGALASGFGWNLFADEINILADVVARIGTLGAFTKADAVGVEVDAGITGIANVHGGTVTINALQGITVDAADAIAITSATNAVVVTADQQLLLESNSLDVNIIAAGDVDVDAVDNVEITSASGDVSIIGVGGDIKLNSLNAGVPVVDEVWTATNVDGSGAWSVVPPSGIETVDNGLTENPGSNAQLGGALVQDTFVGAPASGFDLQLDAQNIDLIADAGVKLNAGTGQINIAAVANPVTIDGTSIVATAAGDLDLLTTSGDVSILPGNEPPPSHGDIIRAFDSQGNVRWGGDIRISSWFLPFNAIADAEFPLVGEISSIATGLIADFATTTTMRLTHLTLLVNAITTGGDVVVSGTSVDATSGVPTNADTETITLDGTLSNYQTDKKWLHITGVDISSGAITGLDYDIGRLSYIFDSIGDVNSDIEILGYRLQYQTNNNVNDVSMTMFVVNDLGNKKLSSDTIEDILFVGTNGNGSITDNLRGGGANRDYTSPVTMVNSGTSLSYTMLDFGTFFLAGENVIRNGLNDGFQVIFSGTAGGLNNIEYGTLTVAFRELPL